MHTIQYNMYTLQYCAQQIVGAKEQNKIPEKLWHSTLRQQVSDCFKKERIRVKTYVITLGDIFHNQGRYQVSKTWR